jgi:hypothetical protein
LSAAANLTVAGLVVAAAGIVIQIALGADYPTIPPGLLVLLAGAGLVALATRWRWTTIVGVIVSLFLLVGGALAPQAREQLGDPGSSRRLHRHGHPTAGTGRRAGRRRGRHPAALPDPDPGMTAKTAGGRPSWRPPGADKVLGEHGRRAFSL